VKELLVISQDTSAYGVDLKYRTGFWGGRPLRARMGDLAAALGQLGVWVRLHYVYPYPHVDEVIPLNGGRENPALYRCSVSAREPAHPETHETPASGEDNLGRIRAWREICPDITIRSTFIAGFPGETEDEFRELLDFLDEAELDRVGCFAYSPVQGAKANELPGALPDEVREERRARLMQLQEKISARRLERHVAGPSRCWWTRCRPKARWRAQAPMRRDRRRGAHRGCLAARAGRVGTGDKSCLRRARLAGAAGSREIEGRVAAQAR